MTNSNNTNATSNNQTTSTKLAVLGGIVTTLGDAISTMVAVLALDELHQTKNNSTDNNDRISELEKQINYLTNEIDQQKNKKVEVYLLF